MPSEPGLPVDTGSFKDPLTSEVGMMFEPFTFPVHALTGKDFAKQVGKLFGESVVVRLTYSQEDIQNVVESANAQQVDPKMLRGLTPKGVTIMPAGTLEKDGHRVVINRITIGDMGIWVNAAGTSDDCLAAIQKVVETVDAVSGNNHGWKYYEKRRTRINYGMASMHQMANTLRALLSARTQNIFATLVEKDLASHMIPHRKTSTTSSVAFARVMVHAIECWVSVVEQDGTSNRCRLDLHHMNDEEVADHSVHVISQLDYDSHLKLVRALEELLGEKSKP